MDGIETLLDIARSDNGTALEIKLNETFKAIIDQLLNIAITKENSDVLKKLLSLNITSIEKDRLLSKAVASGFVENAEILIAAGAGTEYKSDKFTALEMAIMRKMLRTVKSLLNAGAKLYSDDKYDHAIIVAEAYNKDEIQKEIHQLVMDEYYKRISKLNLNPNNGKSFTVVVARYNEDLSWIKKEFPNQQVIIYNKGPDDLGILPDNCKVIKLANIGRETESYLNYIVSNYPNFPDRILFIQGNPYDHRVYLPLIKHKILNDSFCKNTFAKCMEDSLGNQSDDLESLNWKDSKWKDIVLSNENMLEFTHHYIGKDYTRTQDIYFQWGGQFAVDKEKILCHDKKYFENLQQTLNKQHPIEVHYIERLWDLIFSCESSPITNISSNIVKNKSDLSIPKIIHRIWMVWNPDKPEIPEVYQEFDKILKSLHPDWQFMEWNDKTILKFINDYYPEFLPTYLSYDAPVKRHDACRYLLLDHFGGVFIQHSFKFQKNIEPLLKDVDLVLTTNTKAANTIANGFLASTQGHEFWKICIKELYKTASLPTLDATGPHFLAKTLGLYVSQYGEESLRLLPRDYLLPFDWDEKFDPTINENCIQNHSKCFELFPKAYSFCLWSWAWKDPAVNTATVNSSMLSEEVYGSDRVIKYENRNKLSIPKIIHRVWMVWNPDKPEIPEIYQEFDKILKNLHPDWQFMEWDDKSILQFIIDYYPEFLTTYLSYDAPVKRHDACRYFLLDHFGGVFIQHSFKFQKNMKYLLEDTDLVFTTFNDAGDYIANNFIASVKGHHFWKDCIKELYQTTSLIEVESTGPIFLRKVLALYIKQYGDSSIRILDHKYLLPFDWIEKEDPTIYKNCIQEYQNCFSLFPNAYAFSLWSAAWVDKVTNTAKIDLSILYTEIDRFSSVDDIKRYQKVMNIVNPKLYENAGISPLETEDTKFCIVVPSYNNVKYTLPCLNSVFRQDYHNWRMIFIDDASDDGTSELISRIKLNSQLSDEKFTILKHETRIRSALYSFYEAANNFCHDNEVMVHLDGDDMLASSKVLTILNNIYKKGQIWITYGQFIYSNGRIGKDFNREVSEDDWSRIRYIPWSTSHLRTSYTWLFKAINIADLQYEGEFFHASGDVALMYPMLEMAGKHRTKFVEDILYLYRLSSTNDHVIYSAEQQQMDRYIRSLPKYEILEKSKDFFIKQPIWRKDMSLDFIDEFVNYLRVYDVYNINGKINSIRLGRDYDGGYIVPELAITQSDVLLGYGIRDDISFEEQYSYKYNKASYGFDCGTKIVEINNPLTHFISECIGTTDFLEVKQDKDSFLAVSSFQQQIESLHLENKNVFIKMDIEGAEYDALPSILSYQESKITGIAIEIHFDRDEQFKSAFNLVQLLSKDFVLTHLHGCNCHQKTFTSKNAEGDIPRILELSYINKSLVTSYQPSKDQSSPSTQDMSICPYLKEFHFKILGETSEY